MLDYPARYTLPFILVHWLLALLIFLLLALGWYLQVGSPAPPARAFLLDLHISLGLSSLLIILIQIVLRFLFKPPAYPEGFSPWWVRLALTVNFLIYACLLLMPLSGYFQAVFRAVPVQFWGIALPLWGVADPVLAGFFWTVHGVVAFVLSALILVHIVLVLISAIQNTGMGARMLPGPTPEPAALVEAEPPPPTVARLARSLARHMRIYGWLSFWLQLVLAFISALLLVFATSGRILNPIPLGFSDGMFWAGHGFFLLCVSALFAFYYTRRAIKVVALPMKFVDPDRKAAFWFFALGMLVGVIGILVSFSGVAASIGLLIAKTVSQPPGIAITDPSKIIRALDVFVLLVNFNLLIGHFLGTAASFWLIIRSIKTQHEFFRVAPAKALAKA